MIRQTDRISHRFNAIPDWESGEGSEDHNHDDGNDASKQKGSLFTASQRFQAVLRGIVRALESRSG